MAMRIRVTTRADLFEKRKQQHIERGYRMEDERPISVNGFCSFIGVTGSPGSAGLTELGAQAFTGIHGGRRDLRGMRCHSERPFVLMANVVFTLVMTPRERGGRNGRNVKG